MNRQQAGIEVNFTIAVREIPEAKRLAAERKAKEAYVMELLRKPDISAGRAAKLLRIDRLRHADVRSKLKMICEDKNSVINCIRFRK